MLKLDQVLYRDKVFSLSASCDVKAAEVTAVLGPSGAGKTTLLNLIAGFAPLVSGRISLGGTEISAISAADRPVSMVFQDNNVFPHLTLAQNVGLGLAAHLRLNAAQEAEVEAALLRVGLDALARRKPGDVSGGERQRVSLARVLVRKRPVLLLDEPFAALDPGLRRDMLALVAAITRERKLVTLLVSHQPLEVAEQAQSAIFISGGVARAGVPMRGFLSSKDLAICAYLGSTP